MSYKQPLLLNLSIPHFDNSLRHRPTKLKDYMNSYINEKEMFDLQQRHATETNTFTSNKNFFSNPFVNIFMFTSSNNFNNNNNACCLLILQTQTHQNNSSKLNIA